MEEKPSAKKVKAEEEPVAKKVKTEEEHGHGSNTSIKSLDTAKADKLVWLMKLPQAVAKSWNSHPSSDPHPVAKVVLSFDPLEADETSALQFKMEIAGTEAGNKGKSYSMNMSKDFVPMCVFSEAIKVIDNDRGVHMRPMPGMIGLISTNSKDKKKPQLVQETDQPAQFLKEILNELCVYNKRGTNQGTYELKPEYKKSVDDTAAE
ncbi:hypothetical protein M0R45_012437 [Rubus argutus]|uniref:Transcription initiation factor IIF subunit beta n=1 Tax=Rubus argutus TaxID=59490 RepID=A0AAW1YCQ5_RUBAR